MAHIELWSLRPAVHDKMQLEDLIHFEFNLLQNTKHLSGTCPRSAKSVWSARWYRTFLMLQRSCRVTSVESMR